MTAPRSIFHGSVPADPPLDILDWAEANVRLKGSVRSELYDRNTTPWTSPIIQWQFDDSVKRTTFIKPVQSGGSVAGLVTMCAWARWRYGLIIQNWEKDEKAENKWEEVILPTLLACSDLQWAGGRWESVVCKAKFMAATLRVQGVFNPDNLDSDSVPLQINEEVHAWKSGHLAKARGRQTAVWNPKALDISNAGRARPTNLAKEDKESFQLHDAFLEGTQQHWGVKCPGCGFYHVMRTVWSDDEPQLGGLRYDSVESKRDDGGYDYNKLRPTIFYQMPCGFKVRDDLRERRALSLSGRYGEPNNTGCDPAYRSATLDAVSVDYIPWLQLIQEKHTALAALRAGDPEPYRRYVTERECRFWDKEDRPLVGKVILSPTVKKSREGLRENPQFAARFFAGDYQQGARARGQFRHYWLVVRDVLSNCDSQLVYEGMVETESDMLAVLDAHDCQRRCGLIDATFDPDHIREFCFRSGINTTLGGKSNSYYTHSDKTIHIYSEEKPLHTVLNCDPKKNYSVRGGSYAPDPDEPMEWFYHKYGCLHRLNWLRTNGVIKHEVPADVSDAYRKQNEAWEFVEEEKGRQKERVQMWKQTKRDDHLMLCECYIAMLMDMSGLLGRRIAELGMPDLLGVSPGQMEEKG